MKRTHIKRTATAFLSLILVCVCLISILTLPVKVSAAKESSTSQKTEQTTDKKPAETKPKKRPTYTDTLAKNNELLDKLANPKKESKVSKVLKKAKDQGADWIDLADSIKKTAENDEADIVDWAEVGIGLLSTVAGIWGLDKIVDSIFKIVEDRLSSGEEPLSEVQNLSDDMTQQFNSISDDLSDVQKQLSALSQQTTDSVNAILSGTQAQINNLDAKQLLREFMMSGDAGFSYLDYSNYLYGTSSLYTNSTEAYYIRLLEAIKEQRSDEEIKACYDNLFNGIYNNIGAFNQYYYGEVVGMENKSIVMYYYDYLAYNPDLIPEGSTAEYEAMMFALDLYTSYVYSYELLEMCYSYQLLQMFAADSNEYLYNINKATVTESTIRQDYEKMALALSKAEAQAAENLAYIFGMKDSYITEDAAGNLYEISNNGDSFGMLATGHTVYLNAIPDAILSEFALDANEVRYYINGTECFGFEKAVIRDGTIYGEIFTATVKYGDELLYSIPFTRIDAINNNPLNAPIYAFSGGSGTADDPYLISNAVQFDLIENDLGACYQLISDIRLGTRSPIGGNDPFTGTFDGNGYTISYLQVESLGEDPENLTATPSTGMFGTISRTGVVKNLTLSALCVVSDYQEDQLEPAEDTSYFCIGSIAGTNKGIISNCTITNGSKITVNREKHIQDSRSVIIYVGGIAGENNGIIEYCSVDDLTINANATLLYYGEPDAQNQLSVYVGGIAATTANIIRNCRVSENCVLSAFAKSTANSEDKKEPYVTVYVGGIIADESVKDLLSNVYSNCTIKNCGADVYNEGKKYNEHRYTWDNVSLMQGQYYPVFFPLYDTNDLNTFIPASYNELYLETLVKVLQECDLTFGDPEAIFETLRRLKAEGAAKDTAAAEYLGANALSGYEDESFTLSTEQKSVEIELTEDDCAITATLLSEIFNKWIDEEKEIKNVQFVNELGEAVKATIIGYYGFVPYHESTDAQEITVKVIFSVDGILYTDDVTITVEGKKLVDCQIEDFLEDPFIIGSDVNDCFEAIYRHGFRIVYTYSNGQTEEFVIIKQFDENGAVIYDSTDTVMINAFSTATYGEKSITIMHLAAPDGSFQRFQQTVEIVCDHTTADFTKAGSVAANCKFQGYEIWECGKGCGTVIHKNYVKGDHTYVVTAGQAATCRDAGYTQTVSCSVCEEVFEDSAWIQTLPHHYVPGTAADFKVDDAYPASAYHYCTAGDHYEFHQYTVTEYVDENGTLVYLYTCFCGYEDPVPDYNIFTKEKGELPTVLVTDGYVLYADGEMVTDQVVVYVQILNNPGFKAATFGIRYGEGLELLSVEESDIVPQQLKVKNEVYKGYNFLWAEGDGNVTTEDGYLLKLTFKYVDGERKPQNVSVVYGMNDNVDGGFCTLESGIHKFMTQSGTISVVDHLPGDVNNDNVVDIMDATYISWYFVGKLDENGNPIRVEKKYADVNLDGKIDLEDVLAILQSISGRYGTNLLRSDYELFFNLNGFTFDEVDESVLVKFYDENGNHTTWSQNVDFAKYEATMKALGYTFVGWYTRRDCTCTTNCTHLVDVTGLIAYDKYQGSQTLYARWEKNKVIFDMGGTNEAAPEDITFDPGKHSGENAAVEFPTPSYSFNVNCYVGDSTNTLVHYPGAFSIQRIFDGWYLDGEKVTQEQLLQLLTAPNGGQTKLVAHWRYQANLPVATDPGYGDITQWYLDKYWTQPVTAFDEALIAALQSGEATLYGKRELIKYSITYVDDYGLAFGSEYPTQYDVTQTILLSDLPNRTGHTFEGWFDEAGTPITRISGIGDRVITAKWTAHKYDIVYNINPPRFVNTSDYIGGRPFITTFTQKDLEYDTEYSLTAINSIGFALEGYTFKGWTSSPNETTVVFSDGDTVINLTTAENVQLYAVWEVDPYTIGKYVKNGSVPYGTDINDSYTVYNYINETPQLKVNGKVIVDWSSCADCTPEKPHDYIDAVNSTGTRYGGGNSNLDITSGVTEVYFIGNPNAAYSRVHIIPVNYPAGSALTVHLINMNLTADGGIFDSWYGTDWGDAGMILTINCIGNNTITATASGGVAINHLKNLHFTGSGTMTIEGGDGDNATTASGNGSDGGTAIIVDTLTVDMTGTLNVTGGAGGNGKNGADGASSIPSYKKGHDGRNATGGGADGGDGDDGGDGGHAGKGGYAYDVTTLLLLRGTMTATGGKSGDGGNGGAGGNGGYGQEAGGQNKDAGDGGDGGDGGNGGNTYIVAASDGTETILTYQGSLSRVNGAAGTAGKAGGGGAAGDKGMHCDNDNCGQWLTWGSDGKNGTKGSSGSAGETISIP